MLVRKCDRCGKYSLDLDDYIDISATDVKLDNYLFGDPDEEMPQVQLCRKCAASLKSWLKITG